MFHSPISMLSRRSAMKVSAGLLGTSVSGWFEVLAARAAEATSRGAKPKSCILLFMGGGPSQAHTFDVKPEGEYKTIPTTVSGIQISEYLPKIAAQMKHLALLRSMTTTDANHASATYLMHTGYRKVGPIPYPSLGSLVSAELDRPEFDLPKYVGLPETGSEARYVQGPGHLGARHMPLIVQDATQGIANLKAYSDQADVDARVELVDGLDQKFLKDYQAQSIEAHRLGYQQAVRLMKTEKAAKAFKIDDEPASVRKSYGDSKFGQNCLVARRLVEAGVPFVEVVLGGWDHHGGAAERVKPKSEIIDPAMSGLVADLQQRGMLDSTLVIWMGEFGRSPIKGDGHYPKAWTTVLAGGGLKTGQVVGRTDSKGATVEETPIKVGDFMATVLKTLGIDPAKNYTLGNRPIGIVAKGSEPVSQLFAS